MALGYTDTPILPDSGYHVHDGERAQPPVVTPGATSADPPSGAVILFDGSDADRWKSARTGDDCPWTVENGYLQVVPKTGDIQSVDEFGDVQLHIEFAAPSEVKGDSQGRGNSGIFLMGRYEIQVLDCYDNPTYADGTTGALYGQWPPLVNACRKPGEWQVYDIVWSAPRFDGDTLVKPACATVILNGVVLHHHKELHGPTQHRALASYGKPHATGPIRLQDHGDLVRFRNIWARPIGAYDDK